MKVPKTRNEREAAKAAAAMARAGAWERLEKFTGKACPRFPDSAELAGLRYGTLRELKRDTEAAHGIVDFLLRHPEHDQAREWLASVVRFLTRFDRDLVGKLSRWKTLPGRVFLVRILVGMRNSGEALRWFEVLDREFPGQGQLTRADLVDLLYKAELYEAAESVLWEAIAEAPEEGPLVRRLVEVLLELVKAGFRERLKEATAMAATLLEDQPEEPEAWFAMALCYRAASRPELAYPLFERFFERFPDHPFRSAHVFDSSYVESLDPERLFALRKAWSARTKRLTACSPSIPLHGDRDPRRRLRIGYISPDFGKHPVGYFFRTVLTGHDPEAVEVFLYSQRDPVGMDDAVSREFRAFVGDDHWRWIAQVPPKELVEMIRKDRIDILVDLAGHSANNRIDAVLHRSAPVQVHWLGFAASTGAGNMDYRISDEITEPVGTSEHLSTEEIWRLPRGFHAISMPEGLPDPVPPPCLKKGYLTFGSFNNVNKLGVRTLELWSGLLRAVPESRLVLKHQTMEVFDSREAIRSAFALHGVDPERIAFKGVTRLRDDHFRLYGLMDVALDPLGYNGTTTTCEALYMGVPVLTLPGATHASRVSASLLHQVGLDGWIARDEAHFLRIARAASAQPEALARRRASLRSAFLESSLSDGIGLARALEEAYRSMWRRACGAAQPLQNVNP